jgi:hypothetical protein
MIDRNYVSDHTRFIQELMKQKPHLADEQRKSRAIWWDREVDLEEQQRYREAKVPQSAYAYFPLVSPADDGKS